MGEERKAQLARRVAHLMVENFDRELLLGWLEKHKDHCLDLALTAYDPVLRMLGVRDDEPKGPALQLTVHMIGPNPWEEHKIKRKT